MTHPSRGPRPRMFRQGDVLLIAVAAFDTAGLDRDPTSTAGRNILAWGEATGHTHAVAEKDAEVVIVDDDRYLIVGHRGAVLAHEEHGPIDLDPGTYRVVRQRESVADPSVGMMRRVRD